jgi:eukaryotic-like serine/threonine-protein kinase
MAFAALLIASSMVSTYLAIRAARDQAEIAQALNDFLQQDLLGQADADNQAMLGVKPDPDVKVRTLLDRAAERIADKFTHKPLVEAVIRRTPGETYYTLNLCIPAKTHFRRSLALTRRELWDRHPATLNTMVWVACCLMHRAQYAEAESILAESVEGLRRVQGEEHADTLRATWRFLSLLAMRGNIGKVEPLLVTTLERSRRVLGADSLLALSDGDRGQQLPTARQARRRRRSRSPSPNERRNFRHPRVNRAQANMVGFSMALA